MEPSPERDGEQRGFDDTLLMVPELQWSRRLNATERTDGYVGGAYKLPLLQWSRRLNATESYRFDATLLAELLGFNGAVA